MLNLEQKEQFSEILDYLGTELEISESQFSAIVNSYRAVGDQLSKEGSILAPYSPEIHPQGSFMIGTMIKSINEDDEVDIDLVCQLTGKNQNWTQADVKKMVGDQLKSSNVYKPMINREGRRCWTLDYSDSANYHMDVLPSVVDKNYRSFVEASFLNIGDGNTDNLAIRITDKFRGDYYYETNHLRWLKSNPFGYAKWFFRQAQLSTTKASVFVESVHPIPRFQKNKLPLQRVVQILKRHRDMMFKGDDDKPISIIITTLAAKAYRKETNILDALQSVVRMMPHYIDTKYDQVSGKAIRWVGNPVNEVENFADKWSEKPEKERKFYKWLKQVQIDIDIALGMTGKGLDMIKESFNRPFGEKVVSKAFNSYGEELLEKRKRGNLMMSSGTASLGLSGGITVPRHTNFGSDEE